MSDDACPTCGWSGDFVTKEDDGGEYTVCPECNRRQDGLGQLQERIGIRI